MCYVTYAYAELGFAVRRENDVRVCLAIYGLEIMRLYERVGTQQTAAESAFLSALYLFIVITTIRYYYYLFFNIYKVRIMLYFLEKKRVYAHCGLLLLFLSAR